MMKYLANHSEQFSGVFGPFLIALMQFIGAFFTEIINILVICSLPTIMEIIMYFIALGAISEIDNYYLASLSNCVLKEELSCPLIITKRGSRDYPRFWDRPKKTMLVQVMYRILRVFQVSCYYYFTPFLAIIFTYLGAGTRT